MSGRVSMKGKNKARVHDSEDDSADEKPQNYQVEPQYLNKPIDPKQAEVRLRTLTAEMKALAGELQKSLEILQSAAQDVAESTATEEVPPADDEIPEDSPQIKAIDKEYKLVLDKLVEINMRHKILSGIRQKILQDKKEVTDIYSEYDQAAKEKIEEYTQKTSRQRYMESEDYKGFRSLIWEALYGDGVPNIKKMIPAEAGDEEDSDDEIEVGAQTTDFKCPLTLSVMKDPMSSFVPSPHLFSFLSPSTNSPDLPFRSTKCKHHFSRAGIQDYLKDGQEHECPIAGCHAKMVMADVVANPNLKKRVEAYIRREREDGGGKSGPKGTQYEVLSGSDDDDE
ncbi:E3 SUMO-protein ligase NSE2, partial [Phenoliferia sp. Uapishka_3]